LLIEIISLFITFFIIVNIYDYIHKLTYNMILTDFIALITPLLFLIIYYFIDKHNFYDIIVINVIVIFIFLIMFIA